jgi:hypothetical protein
MKGTINNSWEDMFGQTFNQWNSCHRLIPNLMLLPQQGDNQLTLLDPQKEESWNQLKGSDWPEIDNISQTLEQLTTKIKQEIESHFNNAIIHANVSNDIMNFCSLHLTNYKKTHGQINELTKNGFLVSNVPIKLQTLHEKKMIINNFDESIEWYNDWATDNDYDLYTKNDIVKLADQEEKVLIRSITESTNLPAVK